MINSRDVKDLHPDVASRCTAFVTECAKQGIDVIITSTYRDMDSQSYLFASGRSRPGPIVTNAKPGDSFHNYKVAFDFVPIQHGKAMWDCPETFKKCGEIAESLGLEWAGRWKSFRELAHCQYTNGLTLRDFKEGKHLPD